jgi:hypothetical protein
MRKLLEIIVMASISAIYDGVTGVRPSFPRARSKPLFDSGWNPSPLTAIYSNCVKPDGFQWRNILLSDC